MARTSNQFAALLIFVDIILTSTSLASHLLAQETPKRAEKAPEIPAQIELLETRVRFETNGDSRKEVHARVHITNDLGVRQFARLNFDYNRSFQQVELPLVRITHASGGTADILPSAISDQPNPAVVNAPAYQDVRVKSVRILGLEPGDKLEYRVITSTTHHPLAPDFWLDHTFDRTGVVSHETFDLDLPASDRVKIQIDPTVPATKEDSGNANERRQLYRWNLNTKQIHDENATPVKPAIIVTTFADWPALSNRLAESLQPASVDSPEITKQAVALTQNAANLREKIEAIYSFVSEKIATVDLPLGSTGFAGRSPSGILACLCATPEDKYVLFDALSKSVDNSQSNYFAGADLTGVGEEVRDELPRPTPFTHLVIALALGAENSVFSLDPSLEVAPFDVISLNYRGKPTFLVARENPQSEAVGDPWETIPDKLPFSASQNVSIEASITAAGTLKTRIRYLMRGDNELLLRVAFHKSPQDKWADVAQLLALSDGLRGKITKVTASDPYETHHPFSVEYEISQPKFVDWSKKPVRIPALLPVLGLPDPLAKANGSGSPTIIELGTPLDVQTSIALHLPLGTIVQTPPSTSVDRDYAQFSSEYSAQGRTVFASRHLKFALRQIPATRAVDYNAFVRAIRNDEAQELTLERPEDRSGKTPSSVPASAPGSKPAY